MCTGSAEGRALERRACRASGCPGSRPQYASTFIASFPLTIRPSARAAPAGLLDMYGSFDIAQCSNADTDELQGEEYVPACGIH